MTPNPELLLEALFAQYSFNNGSSTAVKAIYLLVAFQRPILKPGKGPLGAAIYISHTVELFRSVCIILLIYRYCVNTSSVTGGSGELVDGRSGKELSPGLNILMRRPTDFVAEEVMFEQETALREVKLVEVCATPRISRHVYEIAGTTNIADKSSGVAGGRRRVRYIAIGLAKLYGGVNNNAPGTASQLGSLRLSQTHIRQHRYSLESRRVYCCLCHITK